MTKDTSHACKFCGMFLAEDKYHDEFDFYNHREIKPMLYELRQKAGAMDMDEYAIQRGIRSNRGVVMPAYGRLVNAWRWMKLLEEKDREIDASRPQPSPATPQPADTSLPF